MEKYYTKIGRYTVQDVADAGSYSEDLYYWFFVIVPSQDQHSGKEDEQECVECGNMEKGKIYESDGLFYCLECWRKYEWLLLE